MADTALASEPARDTAAKHMVTGIPRARIDTTVDQVIEALRGTFFECADTVFEAAQLRTDGVLLDHAKSR